MLSKIIISIQFLFLITSTVVAKTPKITIDPSDLEALIKIQQAFESSPERVVIYPYYEWSKPLEGRLAVKVLGEIKPTKVISYAGVFLNKQGRIISLNLSSKHSFDWQLLAPLKKLRLISLDKSNIESIDNFPRLPELEELDLSDNKISKISGIENLPKLRYLNLSFNKIKKIENLDKLKNLEYLNLDRNNLSQIQGLHNLLKLKSLNLRRNIKIKIIEGLTHLKQLKTLEVDGLPITEAGDISQLINLNIKLK